MTRKSVGWLLYAGSTIAGMASAHMSGAPNVAVGILAVSLLMAAAIVCDKEISR